MKTLSSLVFVLALAGCATTHKVPTLVYDKTHTEDCVIAGQHYAASYCLLVKDDRKTGDDRFTRIEVTEAQWQAAKIAR
jgi:hypothetical protein